MPGLSMLACGGSESVWWCEEKNENRERKKSSKRKRKNNLRFQWRATGGEREEKKEKKTRGGGKNVGKYRRTSKKNEYKIEERKKLPRARRPGKTLLIHLHVHF